MGRTVVTPTDGAVDKTDIAYQTVGQAGVGAIAGGRLQHWPINSERQAQPAEVDGAGHGVSSGSGPALDCAGDGLAYWQTNLDA